MEFLLKNSQRFEFPLLVTSPQLYRASTHADRFLDPYHWYYGRYIKWTLTNAFRGLIKSQALEQTHQRWQIFNQMTKQHEQPKKTPDNPGESDITGWRPE